MGVDGIVTCGMCGGEGFIKNELNAFFFQKLRSNVDK